jgi:hypothetical protein
LADFLCSCLSGVARAFTVMFCIANYQVRESSFLIWVS